MVTVLRYCLWRALEKGSPRLQSKNSMQGAKRRARETRCAPGLEPGEEKTPQGCVNVCMDRLSPISLRNAWCKVERGTKHIPASTHSQKDGEGSRCEKTTQTDMPGFSVAATVVQGAIHLPINVCMDG